MVDVTAKPISFRQAVARGEILARPETVALVAEGLVPKGNVFEAARIAGIMAAKGTGSIIPLCHPLGITGVDVSFVVGQDRIEVEVGVSTAGRTGVEMEALTGTSVALLTIYDMCKAVDKGMVISNVRLIKKTGGRSGVYMREETRKADPSPKGRGEKSRSQRTQRPQRALRKTQRNGGE